MTTRHLLEIDDLTPGEIEVVLTLARAPQPAQVLAGSGVALVFEKPSARTRNSMEMAVVGLGGHPVTIRPDEVGLDTRETTEDVARTLACYHAVIGARVFEHSKLERMTAVVDVPVVNMLSDTSHPLQALADLLTIGDEFGELAGRSVAYVGDANNVARSLAIGVLATGGSFRLAHPDGYGFGDEDLARIGAAGDRVDISGDPARAVEGADVVYADVWTSMGQEAESARRRADFAGFGVDDALMSRAGSGAVFMHCLPAHRGEEVEASVLEGQASRVWPQARNRMAAARGVLEFLMEAGATVEQRT
ncbi:MAG: ornithine carbamoyltransferase [Acidimicrobiales bacterium]